MSHSYVVHCHEVKDGRLIERVTKQEFMHAITVATQHKEAKFFKIDKNARFLVQEEDHWQIL